MKIPDKKYSPEWLERLNAADELRPILVGEANPYGGDPAFALYPSPEGSAGERMCHEILCMNIRTYLKGFRRVNLCPTSWSMPQARRTALELLREIPTGSIFSHKRLILLGSKVASAFGVPSTPFQVVDEILLVLPHPSGRCLVWNQEDSMDQVRGCLREFLAMWPELVARIGEVWVPPPVGHRI